MDSRLYINRKINCNFCEMKEDNVDIDIRIDYNNIECCYNCLSKNMEKFKIKSTHSNGYKNIKLDNKDVYIKEKYYNNIKIKLAKEKRELLKNNKKLRRKEQLLNRLKEEKLDFANNSLCDIYINYGMIDLDTLIEDMQKTNESKSKNFIILNNELNKRNLSFNNKVPSFSKYIKSGKNLNECIRIGIIESLVIDKTNYLDNLKKYSKEDALDMAAIEYIDNVGYNKELINYIENITTIKFN